jgi:hypothetical protein
MGRDSEGYHHNLQLCRASADRWLGTRTCSTHHGRSNARRGWSGTSSDGPGHFGGRSGNTQEPQRPRTFKPRRPEIGTWKTYTIKAAGRLVKLGPTFDQLLSKYVKNKASPSDRLPKRPRSPT